MYDENNDGNYTNGKCNVCYKERTKEGHDPCLGTLPGVKFACCGHGGHGYIYWENGIIIRFPTLYEIKHGVSREQDGIKIMEDLSKSRWPNK